MSARRKRVISHLVRHVFFVKSHLWLHTAMYTLNFWFKVWKQHIFSVHVHAFAKQWPINTLLGHAILPLAYFHYQCFVNQASLALNQITQITSTNLNLFGAVIPSKAKLVWLCDYIRSTHTKIEYINSSKGPMIELHDMCWEYNWIVSSISLYVLCILRDAILLHISMKWRSIN